MLKRCFLISRFKAENGKELVLINLHNSAFDDAEELRKEELKQLREIIEAEYQNGNYVVAGGDWNQNPPNYNSKIVKKYNAKIVRPIDNDYLPEEWTWAYDPEAPTNRDVNEPFDPKTTNTTIIDYFIISPNIEVLEVKTIDQGFEYSDHQPVIIKLNLNP
jgi:endonuclease/exonuclease/phosphatase family metal-dependent hydrolase